MRIFCDTKKTTAGLSWHSSPWLPLLEARNSELEAQAARVQFLEARIAELEARNAEKTARIVELENQRTQPNEEERH